MFGYLMRGLEGAGRFSARGNDPAAGCGPGKAVHAGAAGTAGLLWVQTAEPFPRSDVRSGEYS